MSHVPDRIDCDHWAIPQVEAPVGIDSDGYVEIAIWEKALADHTANTDGGGEGETGDGTEIWVEGEEERVEKVGKVIEQAHNGVGNDDAQEAQGVGEEGWQFRKCVGF